MPLAIVWEDVDTWLTLSLMWFAQLSWFNFEAGLSASVNRALDYHMGRHLLIYHSPYNCSQWYGCDWSH